MRSNQVLFTRKINSQSLLKLTSNLIDVRYIGRLFNVGVKISTGEPPRSNYLKPELLKDVVQMIDGTIVECNTAYEGARSNTFSHQNVIKQHGFNSIANVEILDGGIKDDVISTGNSYFHISENYVGGHMKEYDYMLVISHFKGHQMAGFGGALKNISIGLASAKGKSYIHSAGSSFEPLSGDENYDTHAFLESMADACSSILNYYQDRILFVNVMNHISIDCDCNGNPAMPEVADIGIAASFDPVALDTFCLDMVFGSTGCQSFIDRVQSLDGFHLLHCCEDLGLGTMNYDINELI